MKINFPALFQTPVQKYRFFFIFGNDKDVFERAIYYLQKTFKSPLIITDEKEVLKASPVQPSLFEDSLSGGITLVSPVTDKILTQLDTLNDGIYIFTSEKARASSKLVTTFSASAQSLAIASYASPVTTSEFEFLTRETDLAAPFKGLLFKAYQNDYKGLLTTLAKIKLYGDVPESDYASFLDPSSDSDDLTPLLHGFLVRDAKKVTDAFGNLTDADLIPTLRNLTRTFLTLFELMPHKNSSIPWQTMTPPVFFKDQPLYQTALTRWKQSEIQQMLESFLSLERKVKYSGFSGSQVKQSLLLSLPEFLGK